MKWWFLTLFLITQTLILLLFYFLHKEFSPLISIALLIPAIFLSGYILYNLLNEQKERQDKLLEHIVRETLHEINLPISTIEANMKMLSKNLNSTKDLKRVNRVINSLDRLKRLYNLLSYNIKKEILPIEKESIFLDKILKDRVAFFRELNRNRFILNLEPLYIKVDKIGLEQALDNIIENAMKYSNKDSNIEITIKNGKLHIKDYGIGIEQDELSLIYQRYYQESSSNIGEGIGLSIVKSFCDNSGILLKIESKKGYGTEVIMDFKRVILDEKLQH